MIATCSWLSTSPPRVTDLRENGESNATVSGPQITLALARSRIDMPSVTIIIANVLCPANGRSNTRLSTTPNTAMAATARIAPIQYGRWKISTQVRPKNAPTIINSPWAKLTMPVALKISTKPSATIA